MWRFLTVLQENKFTLARFYSPEKNDMQEKIDALCESILLIPRFQVILNSWKSLVRTPYFDENNFCSDLNLTIDKDVICELCLFDADKLVWRHSNEISEEELLNILDKYVLKNNKGTN